MKSKKFLFDTPGWSIPNIEKNPKKKHQPGIPSSNQSSTVTSGQKKRGRSKAQSKIEDNRQNKKNKRDNIQKDSGIDTDQSKYNAITSNDINQSSNDYYDEVEDEESSSDETINKTESSSNNLATNLLNSNLIGSRFRMLNETLYTSKGSDAFKLFSIDNQINQDFKLYHQGFRQQTKSWPQNPIEVIFKLLTESIQFDSNLILIADLGCGEANLAKVLCSNSNQTKSVDQVQKKNKIIKMMDFRVFSYDLVPDPQGWVNVAECSTKVPLPGSLSDKFQSGMMDVVVCCLSLMGTDWVGMILEARRILQANGQLIIAEVTSRFPNVDQFVDFIKLIGFSTPVQDRSNTHFIIFTFKKITRVNPTQLKMNDLDQDLEQKRRFIEKGTKLLKPCIYKRR